MKNNILTLILFLLVSAGFSQNPGYEYRGRLNPAVKKEKLPAAMYLSDLALGLWHSLVLPYGDRLDLDRRSGVYYARGLDYTGRSVSARDYYGYPGEYNYSNSIEYVSVEISAPVNGKVLMAKSTDDKLTVQQKNILDAAGQDTDLRIKIRFRYKVRPGDKLPDGNRIIEGNLAVTVVPETEAEYPGGFTKLTDYLAEHIINISYKVSPDKLQRAIVKFTVSEQGKIIGAKIGATSGDPETDALILDAVQKMPAWKPAENSKGIKVKQELSIPLDGGGGC